MKWIGQDHPNGCGIAAIAMVCGCDLAAVGADYPGWQEHGVYSGSTSFRHLMRHGYFTRIVFRAWDFGQWPPPPFAPAHIAQVTQPSGNGHWVAVDGDGVVFDPLTPERKVLTDWEIVNQVTGFVLVPPISRV